MALRKIVTEGDPVLRKRAREVEKVHNKERMIFDDMVETMRASNGCGLAGPQVGLLKRMIVVEVPDPESEPKEGEEDLLSEGGFHEEGQGQNNDSQEKALDGGEPEKERKLVLYQLANPQVLSMSGSQVGEEGCLSVPGFIGQVERPLKIHIKALDYNGDPVEIQANGFLAVALCHEMDHLEGVLFTDKATDVEKLEDQEE
ncbi:MAG: peptide deformylase [Anaerovoracaceae bacterium]|jgi:peptide deformylase|nr:peptide deformylase [Anaerovoracaceae bacterium]